MEALGLVVVAFALIAWTFYTNWRDNRRWNDGVCKETGQLWEFTGGVSYLGYYCYSGGKHNGETQFIWLNDLRRPYPEEQRIGPSRYP